MTSRFSWLGFSVGALVGAVLRVAVAAMHFPAIVHDPYPIAIVPALVGFITGGVAAATGRLVVGAVVGAAVSFVFYLVALPLVGLLSFVGSATPLALWETLLVGLIPGGMGGWLAERKNQKSKIPKLN